MISTEANGDDEVDVRGKALHCGGIEELGIAVVVKELGDDDYDDADPNLMLSTRTDMELKAMALLASGLEKETSIHVRGQ